MAARPEPSLYLLQERRQVHHVFHHVHGRDQGKSPSAGTGACPDGLIGLHSARAGGRATARPETSTPTAAREFFEAEAMNVPVSQPNIQNPLAREAM